MYSFSFSGLGFNIRGGTDIPHFKEDTGIFVTKLKEAGAAFRDKRLKEGDKILEVGTCTSYYDNRKLLRTGSNHWFHALSLY